MHSRIFKLLICFIILQLSLGFAVTCASEASEKYIEAKAVLDYILGKDYINIEGNITRAEFTDALAAALKVKSANISQIYSDVALDSPYAEGIFAAQRLGWISKSDQFFPDREITCFEAVKIAVAAIGIDYMAQAKGGYPTGYMQVGKTYSLTNGVGLDTENLSGQSGYILIYNLLQSNLQFSGYEAGYVTLQRGGETYLNSIHGIYAINGIVTATTYGSYSTEHTVSQNYILEINGDVYNYVNDGEDLLLKNVTAFCLKDENRIIAAAAKNNTEEYIALDDYSDVKNSRIYYLPNKEERERYYNLSADCLMIFNGRAVSGFDKSLIKGDAGNIRLLDNNSDNQFDAAFIESYSYMLLDKADDEKLMFSDANKTGSYLKIELGDTAFVLYDSNKNVIEPDTLGTGEVLAVAQSIDEKLIKVIVLNKSAYGVTESIDWDEGIIFVDGREYKLSEYALKHYKELLLPGKNINFIFGINGEIVIIKLLSNDFQYGYLIDARLPTDRLSGEVNFKILSQSGKVELYKAKKVSFDGSEAKKTEEDIINMLSENKIVKDTVIRYSQDLGGYINHIDLPSASFDFLSDSQIPQNDSLRRFTFSATSFRYRSSSRSCSPYFNLDNSIVFKIPVTPKEAKDNEFMVLGTDSLLNDTMYSFEVYDLQKAGAAALVVERYNPEQSGFNSADRSYIVESIANGVLPDDTIGKIITCYTNGAYHRVYLPLDITVYKDSKTELCPGDIIEFKPDPDNIIKELMVDFDASSGFPVKNSGSTAAFEEVSNAKNYQFGSVYQSNGTYAYLSNTAFSGADYEYSFSTIKNFSINTSNVVKFNTKTREVRPVTALEIKSHAAFGTENHYIVIRQNYQSPQMIFVYE